MIQIEGLMKKYGDFTAVKDLSVSVPKGQILGLLGPNGAGKSTTLRILTGYMKANLGKVTVGGLDVQEQSLVTKKMIGYLPESAPLYPDMLVYDYLSFIAKSRSIARREIDSKITTVAELCSLTDVMGHTISSLSRGFKQRVGLAMAMIDDPEVLILDEPTSGLDPNQIIEIRRIIKEVGQEKTVIFSTHILSEAEATCDRVIIINEGSIVADGDAASLKASFGSSKQRLEIILGEAELSSVKAEFAGFENKALLNTVFTEEDGNVVLSLDSSQDIRSQVYRLIKKHDWDILGFNQEQQTLEDVFRLLTENTNSQLEGEQK